VTVLTPASSKWPAHHGDAPAFVCLADVVARRSVAPCSIARTISLLGHGGWSVRDISSATNTAAAQSEGS
jgi:hypothetical protein